MANSSSFYAEVGLNADNHTTLDSSFFAGTLVSAERPVLVEPVATPTGFVSGT
jgi:hypothetical protein